MSTAATGVEALAALRSACAQVGLDPLSAEPLRLSENAIYRLPGGVVAKIGRAGQDSAATKEVRVARWLATAGIPAVQVLPGVDQPVLAYGRPVTFWRELPPHEHGTPLQVASALRRLHDLVPPTEFELPPLAPFVRLAGRIDRAVTFSKADRAWMRSQLVELQDAYAELPDGLPHRVVHGDAWVGNVVSTADGTVLLLDLERCSVGPPEWDLVSTAIKHSSFGWVSAEDYAGFCEAYGHDVTAWSDFEVLRDIRELRMTSMAAQVAAEDQAAHEQAVHRLACLRGEHGPRPWSGWHAVP